MKKKFWLAKTHQRIFTRIIDYLIGTVISLAIILPTILINNNYDFYNLPQWKYFFISIITLLIFSFLFILLPCFWNGYTIGGKLLKIKIYFFKNKLLSIIINELFYWGFFSISSLILGVIILCCQKDYAKEIIMYLLPNSKNNFNVVGQIFQTLYGIWSLLLFLNIINIFLANKKQTIVEKISNIALLSLVENKEKIKINNNVDFSQLPGVTIPDDE
jgi:hypothetical protein